jgi:predicted AAA+ superfamily ATPase
MDKLLLKEIVVEQKDMLIKKEFGVEREWLSKMKKYVELPLIVVISGLRRVGKSTLLKQIMQKYYQNDGYYLNFEDERLLEFTASDFNFLLETFVELYGEKKAFFFDEIQNIPKWELFVRRMHDRGCKIFITGSNASLLSREIGTRLTGRYLPVQLFPFSFKEFLLFNAEQVDAQTFLKTSARGRLKKKFSHYLMWGGMPEFLKYKNVDLLKNVYEDILYRDIVARYEIKEVRILRELGLYFMSNIGALFSYNRLRQSLGLGSVNTAKNYTDYLENSYLLYAVNQFSFSLKKQIQNAKKAYIIDNGILEAVAFQFSQNRGKYLENIVFVELKRRNLEIYYYKTSGGFEVDFAVKKGRTIVKLVQVVSSLNNKTVKDREVRALLEASKELGTKNVLILTEEDEDVIKANGIKIEVKPIYKWLCEEQ